VSEPCVVDPSLALCHKSSEYVPSRVSQILFLMFLAFPGGSLLDMLVRSSLSVRGYRSSVNLDRITESEKIDEPDQDRVPLVETTSAWK